MMLIEPGDFKDQKAKNEIKPLHLIRKKFHCHRHIPREK